MLEVRKGFTQSVVQGIREEIMEYEEHKDQTMSMLDQD
jgi:hypothetical protein